LPDRTEKVHQIMNGQARGLAATVLRGLLRTVEPGYALAMLIRNRLFDRDLLLHAQKLPRPVISVGNITTGGTGKTPVVTWLAHQLQERSLRVAVLLRGYKKSKTSASDEQMLLQQALPRGIVLANPDRFSAATTALRQGEAIDVFVLDDGFQHRRVQRDFDLVLIDATAPFGYGHVLPRGMLREPIAGLSRASAILITRCDAVAVPELTKLKAQIATHTRAPHFHCSHRLTHVQIGSTTHAIEHLQGKRVLAFAGIGNPNAFATNLTQAGATVVGTRWFPDHHPYAQPDLEALQDQARRLKADLLVTTQKDQVKLHQLVEDAGAVPLATAILSIAFRTGDDQSLLNLVLATLRR
jgi:tetraacyldisaccharide 4'-kinase